MITTLNTSAHDLRAIPDGSVHAVMTSPPYYGLRSYAGEQDVEWPTVVYRLNEFTEPLTVPGCAPDCAHVWVDGPVDHQRGRVGASTLEGGPMAKGDGRIQSVIKGRYCQRCGGWRGPLGLEPSPVAYIGHLILCLREWRRVLRDDGCVFVNLGDSYAGSGGAGGDYSSGGLREGQPKWKSQFKAGDTVKPKDLLGIPWMFAFAARADGWYLRSGVTWIKGNPMPESVTDRPTKATEMIFMLAKSQKYYYDLEATRSFSVAFRSAVGASLSGSALAPKFSTTLDTDNGTAYFRGSLDLGQSQVSIVGAMTLEAERLKVVKTIRFEIIGEVAERDNVIDLEVDSSAALDAFMSVSIKHLASHNAPIRATIIDPTSPEGWTCFSDAVNAVPFSNACSTAKSVIEPISLLRRVASEDVPAVVAFDFGEASSPLYVFGTFRSSHMPHDTINNVNGQTGANLRDWWYVNTRPYAKAHYAVWPETLVEPMILASTSARGCCPQCGAGWRRVVEKQWAKHPNGLGNGTETKDLQQHQRGETSAFRTGGSNVSTTIGWEPSCDCDAGEPIPCTVLDPFAGSGTTGRVAIRHRRAAILCDISGEYLEEHVPDRTTVQMRLGVVA